MRALPKHVETKKNATILQQSNMAVENPPFTDDVHIKPPFSRCSIATVDYRRLYFRNG